MYLKYIEYLKKIVLKYRYKYIKKHVLKYKYKVQYLYLKVQMYFLSTSMPNSDYHDDITIIWYISFLSSL